MRLSGVLLLVMIFISSCSQADDKYIRSPAVAGAFYPGEKNKLEKTIRGFLKNVPDKEIEGEIIAGIAPHAGYVYSGQVAAYTHKYLAETDFETIVIIGHNTPYEDMVAFLSEADIFRTPLGDVPVDKNMVKEILAFHPRIIAHEGVHSREHTVEVQLPFLQFLKKKFKIVPILFGVPNKENCKILADAIIKASKNKKVAVLASTDMTHYPSYKDAYDIDNSTLKIIEKLDIEKLFSHLAEQESKGVRNLSTALCASGGVGTAIIFAKEKGANNVEILKYANSGDVPAGDKSKVVGYGAAVITGKKAIIKEPEESKMLNENQRKKLLQIARQTIEEYLKDNEIPKIEVNDPVLKQKAGCFVTLNKHGRLRGCIGHFDADTPLFEIVSKMAIQSSNHDSRFPPVKLEEMKDIEIEISVLSPLRPTDNPLSIKKGIHGIYIKEKKGYRGGTYLPQVWIEHFPDKDAEYFWTHLSEYKAGLPSDAWKYPERYEILIYDAAVFSEE